MIVRIFRSGISRGESPVNYLLGDVDHAGQPRSLKPEVLAGDPQTTIEVINSIQRKHKYISGCLSFRDSEKPSRHQLLEIIDDFKATFCPGLTSNHFNSLFILHQEKGNTEVHFVIPSQELTSGRRMNIHPPGKSNLEFFASYTRVTNHRLGYAQVVEDPLKMTFSDFELKTTVGRKAQSDKRWIHKELVKALSAGAIKNREDLCRHLDEEFGVTVTRQGNDYLAVKFPGAKKAKRLCGPLYSKDIDFQFLLARSVATKQPTYLSEQELASEQKRLDLFIHERMKLNVQAYLAPRMIRRMAKQHTLVRAIKPMPHTTSIKRSSIMENAIRLPVIRGIIISALEAAREKLVVRPRLQLVQPKSHKETVRNISMLREKAFGKSQSGVPLGFVDLTLAIVDLETALVAATSELEYAQTFEMVEDLRQRIIKLQLELERLQDQKMRMSVCNEKSEIQFLSRKNID